MLSYIMGTATNLLEAKDMYELYVVVQNWLLVQYECLMSVASNNTNVHNVESLQILYILQLLSIASFHFTFGNKCNCARNCHAIVLPC